MTPDPTALLLPALVGSAAANVILLRRLRAAERERLESEYLADQWRASSRFWRTQAAILKDACRECLNSQRQLVQTLRTATRRPRP